jgi:hypothetical protein
VTRPTPSQRPVLRAGSGDREQEVQGLAVDGAEEQRHREHRQVEDRAARALGAEAILREPVQEDERRERACERDDDPGEDVVPAEGAAEARERERVQRVEGRRDP